MDLEAPTPPPATRPRKGLLALVLVAALAAVAGFLIVRKFSSSSAPSGPAAAPAAGTVLPSSLVLLNSKAAMIADRYNCLCGECSDTLGKCTCSRDKGSNEMKTTLNQLAEQKKSVAEIDAAMVQKYGAKVLVAGAPAPSSTPSNK